MRRILFALLALGMLCAGPVWAQQKGTFLPDKVKWKTKKKDGWFPDLDASFNFSFSQSDGVIGVPDGTTLSFGLQLHGGLVFSSGPHEWRSTLVILHTQTKLPTIKSFLKSADKLELETGYVYRFPKVRWIGLFGSLKMETALLSGFLVKDADATLEITENDQTTKKAVQLKAQVPYELTKGFAPFQFKQSLGVSLTPLERRYFLVNFKLGGGAVQTWTQGGLLLNDDAATTDKIELSRMRDYVQMGAEAKLLVKGVLFDRLLNYALLGTIMLPFYTSIDTSNKNFADLLSFDASFKLGIKVFQWLAINYALTVVYAPLIQPKVQVTNNLVLSLTWSIL